MGRLSHEEQDLRKSYDQDEWRSIKGRAKEIRRYREYARTTFKKDKRVNIRISTKDLDVHPLVLLDGHRSVQFVQTEQQKQNLATFLSKRRGAANAGT